MPSTKQMESRMLDFPEPLSPVMALKDGSKPDTTVRVAYDLKPSITTSSMYMAAGAPQEPRRSWFEVMLRLTLSWLQSGIGRWPSRCLCLPRSTAAAPAMLLCCVKCAKIRFTSIGPLRLSSDDCDDLHSSTSGAAGGSDGDGRPTFIGHRSSPPHRDHRQAI